MTGLPRLGWTLFATTCACLAAYVALDAYPDGHLFTMASIADGFPVIPLGVLLSGLLGALVVAGQPRHPVGWLLAVAATGGAVGFATGAYAYRALTTPGFGPAAAGHWSGWVSQFFGAAEYRNPVRVRGGNKQHREFIDGQRYKVNRNVNAA